MQHATIDTQKLSLKSRDFYEQCEIVCLARLHAHIRANEPPHISNIFVSTEGSLWIIQSPQYFSNLHHNVI